MSHDPLEGVRPSDSVDPSEMRPREVLDRPASPPAVARSGGSPKLIAATLIGVLCAVAAGAMAFYLTERPSPPAPRPSSTAPTAQPSGGNSTGDVVQQGVTPSDTK